jgi:hypothetical protein
MLETNTEFRSNMMTRKFVNLTSILSNYRANTIDHSISNTIRIVLGDQEKFRKARNNDTIIKHIITIYEGFNGKVYNFEIYYNDPFKRAFDNRQYNGIYKLYNAYYHTESNTVIHINKLIDLLKILTFHHDYDECDEYNESPALLLFLLEIFLHLKLIGNNDINDRSDENNVSYEIRGLAGSINFTKDNISIDREHAIIKRFKNFNAIAQKLENSLIEKRSSILHLNDDNLDYLDNIELKNENNKNELKISKLDLKFNESIKTLKQPSHDKIMYHKYDNKLMIKNLVKYVTRTEI